MRIVDLTSGRPAPRNDLTTVRNLSSALAISALENVDVVVIDLDPGMHALAILEAIGGHEVAPPVIALTSLEESEVMPIASRHGAVTCLGKPFQHSSLAKAIERCLAQPRSTSCDLWGHPRQRRRHARAGQPA